MDRQPPALPGVLDDALNDDRYTDCKLKIVGTKPPAEPRAVGLSIYREIFGNRCYLLAELVRGGKSEIRKAERAYESRNKAAGAFGGSAADQVYGKRIDRQTRALEKHTIRVEKLTKRLENLEDRIGDRVEKGSYKGTKDGTEGKRRNLQGFVKEARR